ncbi:MAG TPA: ABC transporter permease [Clostridia bacterium]|nr:ABC transporter permease [Clostridia bacterium]
MKALCRIFRYKTFMVGLLMVLSVLFVAAFAKALSPYAYDELNLADRLQPPSAAHLFGTDNMGRDIFSRVLQGSRLALSVAFVAMAIQCAIGVGLGLVAGYYGKTVEKVISFVTYLVLSLPALVVIIALITLLGPSLTNAIIAISLVAWAGMTRLVTVKTMAVRNLPYVEAAKAFGESDASIIFRYILPNISPIIIILMFMAMPASLLLASSVSFMGIGAQIPEPEWGAMVSDGMNSIVTHPWISLYPGAVLSYTIIGFNLLGEGLRDVLDPTLRV